MVAMAVGGAVLFFVLQRALAGAWLAVGAHPEVIATLERTLDDERRLARLEPERAAEHRARFVATERLLQHLRVLDHNRAALSRRFAQILLAAASAAAIAAVALVLARATRRERRLERLGTALAALAEGRVDVAVGPAGRGVLGRIARMIEETSRQMARDRRRLAALRDLSGWQEAARRHAHEMRTPLTAARLELERLRTTAREPAVAVAVDDALQELERLRGFIHGFTSFARLPRPQLREEELGALLAEIAATFAGAWPGLELVTATPPEPVRTPVDRDLLRQVIVNLCDNAAQAMAPRGGRVVLAVAADPPHRVAIDVADDGPGVAPEIQDRLFEPYVTTRAVGEGMGLGLAISRKILLDHGGDLELRATSSLGTTFRLTLPTQPSHPAPSPEDDR